MKNKIQKTALLFLFTLITSLLNAQSIRDVVVLKNGSLIKGTLIEQYPPDSLKIKTSQGNIFVYNYDEIENVSKEYVASPNQDIFIIKKPFRKSTYNNTMIKKMKNKELMEILSKDQQAISTYKTGNALSLTGTGLILLGSIIMFTNTLKAVNDPYSETNYSATILLDVLSIPLSIAGGSMRKNAIRKFNKNKTRTSDLVFNAGPVLLNSNANNKAPGIGLKLRF